MKLLAVALAELIVLSLIWVQTFSLLYGLPWNNFLAVALSFVLLSVISGVPAMFLGYGRVFDFSLLSVGSVFLFVGIYFSLVSPFLLMLIPILLVGLSRLERVRVSLSRMSAGLQGKCKMANLLDRLIKREFMRSGISLVMAFLISLVLWNLSISIGSGWSSIWSAFGFSCVLLGCLTILVLLPG